MGSHDSFGHLQQKLWQKERSGVKTGNLTPDHKKSRIDPTSMHASGVWYIVGKLLMIVTTLLQTSSSSNVWARNYSPAKLWEFQPWQFRDSPLGVLGQKTIWMWASQRGAKYIIWGKVVTSLESGLWWILWVRGRPWLVLAPKVLQHCINQLMVSWM